MFYYLLLSCIVIFLGGISYNRSYEKQCVIIIVIVLVLFSGLRGDFTSDYNNYLMIYNNISEMSYLEVFNYTGQEKGFSVFTKLVSELNSELLYMFVFSILTIGLFSKRIIDYSQMAWLSLVFFVTFGSYYTSFNIMRNILACAIAFYGVRYIINRKPVNFLICVIIATLFHSTAVVMIPLYFVLNIRVNNQSIVLLVLTTILTFIALPNIINLVVKLVPRYSIYLKGEGILQSATIGNLAIPMIILMLLIVSFFLVDKEEFSINETKERVFVNAVLLYVAAGIIGMQAPILFRVSEYLSPFVWITLPNMITKYRTKDNKVIVVLLILILALTIPSLTMRGTGYMPYYFFYE